MKKRLFSVVFALATFYAQANDPCAQKGWQDARMISMETGESYFVDLEIGYYKDTTISISSAVCWATQCNALAEKYADKGKINLPVQVKLSRNSACEGGDTNPECAESYGEQCVVDDLKILSTPKTDVKAKGVRIEKQKYGIQVTNCSFDFDGEKFCTDKRLKKYAQVLKSRKANFDKDKILFIFNANENEWDSSRKALRVVVIEKKTGIVSSFYYTLLPAEQAVNKKGEPREFIFNKQSNKFCYKGNIYAYRNAHDYDPKHSPEFCFIYNDKTKKLEW